VKKLSLLTLILSFILVSGFMGNYALAGELEQIRQAIREKGASWTAEDNWITQISPAERKNLLGAILDPAESTLAPLLNLPPADSLPAAFDWRYHNGNWITPVKNQANCGSCWDFSAIAQVETWWKIYHANLDSMIDLSEQFILSCGDAGSCSGGSAALALEFVKNVGVPSEACLPYFVTDTIPCGSACSNWADEAVTIPGWGWITMDEAIIDNLKNAILIHPVSTYLTVFTDLFYYSGGVYQHSWGDVAGGHLVLLVGWDDSEQSWIVKNSWGTNWGEAGYFRIRWGECFIGIWSPFIWNEMAGGAVLSVSPQQLDFSLPAGDTIVRNITINNLGPNTLEYSASDFGSAVLFHTDDFMAWDSLSWWCGDTAIRGYYNNCLQYLETPLLDLSGTNAPHLSWMGLWALENPGIYPPYDGWDGCNVWVSVDGGTTFGVAYPTTPLYNCNYMYSFSNPDGWNLGVTAGWGGHSGSWTAVDFDLSPYKTDSVIIRFAFASDEGLCTLNDSSLYGFFIDDIEITDGDFIIFEDDGSDINSLKRFGYGYFKADWMDLSNSMGQIPAYSSTNLSVIFDAGELSPGDFYGRIRITSNDTILSPLDVPLHVNVTAPVVIQSAAHRIPDRFILYQNYPNPFNPITVISWQLAVGIPVKLKIYNIRGQEIVTLVDEIQPAGFHSVRFDASKLASGVYMFRLQAGDFVEIRKMVVMR
jgi:hypothetical protein